MIKAGLRHKARGTMAIASYFVDVVLSLMQHNEYWFNLGFKIRAQSFRVVPTVTEGFQSLLDVFYTIDTPVNAIDSSVYW
jgi:hypothetical protein